MPDPDEKECGENLDLNYIIGGENATYGEFPFMALLSIEFNGRFIHICGGSLINRRYVVSAAHCHNPEEGRVPLNDAVKKQCNDI